MQNPYALRAIRHDFKHCKIEAHISSVKLIFTDKFSWLQFPHAEAARVTEVVEDLMDMVIMEITGLVFIAI